MQDQRRYTAIFGGIRSGKTHAGTMKALLKCAENPGKDGLVTAPDYNRIAGATLPKYLEVFPKEFISNINRSTNEIDTILGNHIYFRSTTDPQTLRAYEVAWIHMDEGAYSPYEAFGVCQGRMSQVPDAQLWVTTTPNLDNPLNWVWMEFGDVEPEDKQRACYHLNTLLSPFLSDAYKEDLKKQYSEELKLIELEGLFVPISGNCFFDSDILRRMVDEDSKDPIEERKRGTKIFKRSGIGRHYVAGIDTAEGRQAGELVGGGASNPDYQCLRIFDFNTGEDVAEIHCRHPLDEFLVDSVELMKEYNNAYCGIEINFNKQAGQKLIDLGYPKNRVYHHKDDRPGWLTSSTTRMPALTEYEEAVRSRAIVMYNRDSIMEHLSFIRDANGRPAAARNAHDDYVIAGAIAYQMRKFIKMSKGPARRVIYC